eukprot:2310292-Pyramimonas_sp.AAC.1
MGVAGADLGRRRLSPRASTRGRCYVGAFGVCVRVKGVRLRPSALIAPAALRAAAWQRVTPRRKGRRARHVCNALRLAEGAARDTFVTPRGRRPAGQRRSPAR